MYERYSIVEVKNPLILDLETGKESLSLNKGNRISSEVYYLTQWSKKTKYKNK